MFGLLSWLTDTSPFPARWYCGDWAAWLGWLHIGADFATFLAYTTIPILISAFIFRRSDLPFPKLFWLFCLFIFSCGTVHLLEAVIFWTPLYRLSAFLKLIMAIASWATVFALFPAVPRALRLPGLAAMTENLQQEMQVRVEAERALQRSKTMLEQQKGELEDSNRELDHFAHIIAHDLKEPLRGIRNYVRFVDEDHGATLPDDVSERLTKISGMAQRLELQIQSLHDFSKVGRTKLDYDAVNLQAALDEARARLADQITRRGAEVRVPVPLPSAWCDHTRMTSVFQNLISNAIKYSEGEPQVEITWITKDGLIEVRVSDRGIGIPEPLRDAAFQPFKRLTSNREGSGMGLSIAQRVVERHGGQMFIVEGDGPGTTIAFSIPIRGLQDPVTPPPDLGAAPTAPAVS